MLAPDEERLELSAIRYSLASDIVELVVLTADQVFLQTLREAVGPSRRLWHVPSGDQVGDLLLAGGVGILVLDVHSLLETPTVFIGQIKRQFPDLVILVGGPREAENALAPLLSNGTVYRFIHKPLSPGRARLFADTAVKRYEEMKARGGVGGAVSRARRTRLPHPLLLALGGLLAAGGAVATIAWLHTHSTPPPSPARTAPALRDADARAERAQASAEQQARAEDALRQELARVLQARATAQAKPPAGVPESSAAGATAPGASAAPEVPASGSQADASESAGRAAAGPAEVPRPASSAEARRAEELAARALARADEGHLLEPASDDARDYLLAALGSNARDPAVLDAQQGVALKFLAAARAALGRHDLDEAARLIDGAEGIAAPANVANLREQLASAQRPKESDRARELLTLAQERLQQDRLLEPAGDSARDYLTALHALDPAYAGLAAASQDLDARLVTRARGALAQKQYDEARTLLNQATADGYSSADAVTVLRDLDAAADASARTVSASELTLLKSAQPAYPRRAQEQGTQGWVELEFTVSERGEVKDIAVRAAQPLGVFDDAARNALAQWRYQPVLRDGTAVAQRARVRIRFTLDR